MPTASLLDPVPCPRGTDSREIVSRAIEFRDPPRIPYSFFHHPNASDVFTVRSAGEKIRRPTPLGAIYTDEWGITWEVTGRAWDHVKDPPLVDLAELQRYKFPEKDADGNFAPLPRVVERARSAGKYVVAADPIMMFEQARSLMGFEDLMVAPYTQPDALGDLLDRLSDLTIRCIRQYSRIDGIDAFMTWEDWGLQSGLQIDLATFRTYYRPRYQRIIDAVHEAGMHYIWHNCGKVQEMLPDKIAMGVDVVQFDQPRLSGHQRLMDIVGGRICMWNTVDIQWSVLPDVSHEELAEEVAEMVRISNWQAMGGGFMARHYPQPEDIELSVHRQRVIYDAFMKNGCGP